MSHEATNWAIKQRGIKPSSKIVLWHLCDRYHPDHGCFPSQDRLAYDCEMSRATINRCIDELVTAGLVKRHPRIDPKTRKQASTEYTFSFQKTVSQNATRHKKTVSQNDVEPCLKNGDSRVSICDTNLVREPVREPVNAKTRENDLFLEDEEQESRDGNVGSEEEGFEELWKTFPKKQNMPGKDLCRREYKAALKKISHSDLLRAAAAYAKTREGEDQKFNSRLSKWLRDGNYEGFLSETEFNEENLTKLQRNALQEGRVPPSMLDDGMPNHAARHWLREYGFSS